MNKYIIKNCPAKKGTNGFCADGRTEVFCQDVNGCLLKRIFDKCKEELYMGEEYTSTNAYAMGRVLVARSIINMMEVLEVNNEV